MHDGASLNTLYHKCKNYNKCGMVLLIRDTEGQVFGCYVSHAWKISPHYYGNGETFVFNTKENGNGNGTGNEIQIHGWSRSNSLFQLASPNSLAVGGGAGGGFALFVESMLEHGSSRRCATFNSPALMDGEQFEIVVLETFALVSSQRLVTQAE